MKVTREEIDALLRLRVAGDRLRDFAKDWSEGDLVEAWDRASKHLATYEFEKYESEFVARLAFEFVRPLITAPVLTSDEPYVAKDLERCLRASVDIAKRLVELAR